MTGEAHTPEVLTDYATCVAIGARVGLGPAHRAQGTIGERRPCERCGTIVYIGSRGKITEDRAALLGLYGAYHGATVR